LRFEARYPSRRGREARGDPNFLLRVVDIAVWPADRSEAAIHAERCEVEAAKHIIEHPIHFAMHGEKRMQMFAAALDRHAPAFVPRNEILHGHEFPSTNGTFPPDCRAGVHDLPR